MGISQYDPGALGRPAWNAGQKVGVKKPLKQRQIWAIRLFPRQRRAHERSGAVRSGNRQQAARLRFGEDQDRDAGHWPGNPNAGHGRSTEDQTTRVIRDYIRCTSKFACLA